MTPTWPPTASSDPESPEAAGPETAATSRLRRGRLWLRVGLLLAAAGVGYLAVTLYQVWSTGRAYEARPVDAIVVLGAAQYDGRPSPQLAARLDEVVRLWPQDLASVVVVTGGSQPGDRFTEAEASADYLVERGVPESAVVFEDEGASTYESLRSTARILNPGDDRASVLVVTDPFHSLRSRLIAEEVGLEAYVAPTSTSVIGGWRDVALHVKEAGGVAVGRLTGFERLSGLVG